MNNNQIKIFDTTLRDGQQCPGAGMSISDNIFYANLAMKLGIDVLEAGFPSASETDFNIVQTIAQEISTEEKSPIICGLCQLREVQIDRTIQALSPAIKNNKARLHVYFPVDPDLMQASVGNCNSEDILKKLFKNIKKTIEAGLEVEFSPEGYSRMKDNFNFITDLIATAVEAGARVINCPDTIGGGHRLQGKEYFVEKIKKHAAIINKKFPEIAVTWSTHCHNDFGTAVENSINSVFESPVRQIECCINGVGERAGNASLEQCVMLIKHFSKYKNNNFYTNINTEYLQEISDFVSEKMLKRQAHFPITGSNAACHTSGGHTNAILKNPLAYHPFDPHEVGHKISFVFGPLSGGNHAQSIIRERGYICEDSEKAEIAQFIKNTYKDRRKGITDDELMEAYFLFRKPICVTDFDYSKSSSSSAVKLKGRFFNLKGEIEKVHQGKDSALAALKILIDEKISGINIDNYESKADKKGIDAKSICTISVEYKNHVYTGQGIDEDIEISAMKALINVVNVAYIAENFKVV